MKTLARSAFAILLYVSTFPVLATVPAYLDEEFTPLVASHSVLGAYATAQADSDSGETVNRTLTPPVHFAQSYLGGTYSQPTLVIRVEFDDIGFEYSGDVLAERIFGSGNSVNEYWKLVSANDFDLIPARESNDTKDDGIVTIKLERKHPNFGNIYGLTSQELVRDIYSSLADVVNLDSYDKNGDSWLDPYELAVILVIAGYEQAFAGRNTPSPRIWAHKSAIAAVPVGNIWLSEYAMFGEKHGDHLATRGIIAHEMGHLLFDLPDIYDHYKDHDFMAQWDLMALGSWNHDDGQHPGDSPSPLSAWSKVISNLSTPRSADSVTKVLDLAAADNKVVTIPLDPYQHGLTMRFELRSVLTDSQYNRIDGLLVTVGHDWNSYGAISDIGERFEEGLTTIIEPVEEGNELGPSGQTYVSAQSQILYNKNDIQVSMANLVIDDGKARVDLESNVDVIGRSLTYADSSANGFTGSYGGSVEVMTRFKFDERDFSIDGIDWFAHGESVIELAIYEAFDGTSPVNELYKQTISVVEGWNRILFSAPVMIDRDEYYLVINSDALGSYAPVLIDKNGQVSGNTFLKSRSLERFQAAPFDIIQSLLINTTSELQEVDDNIISPVVTDVVDPASRNDNFDTSANISDTDEVNTSNGESSGGSLSLTVSILLLSFLTLMRCPSPRSVRIK